jgi:hypothetical protein
MRQNSVSQLPIQLQPQTFEINACVICKDDDRRLKWIQALLNRFIQVYGISQSGYRVFSKKDPLGTILEAGELPKQVDVILFHSSDAALWENSQIKGRSHFEFNAPGTPPVRAEVTRILRQTAPAFTIQASDIDQLADYVTQTRSSLPLMCCPQLEALPALLSLCQAHLQIQGQSESAESLHWVDALDLTDLAPQRLDQLRQVLVTEWQLFTGHSLPTAIDGLLDAISQPRQAIAPTLVAAAYASLTELNSFAAESSLDSADELPSEPAGETKTILAVRGNVASSAVASTLSTLLHLPQKVLDSDYPPRDWQFFRQAILVLAESQVMSTLARFRAQGFSGSVLVISNQPFDQIKRNYRVLRFGQGSHDAFAAPWLISSLLEKASQLVPMEPENLEFLQNEIAAPRDLYDEKIAPCLHDLKAAGSEQRDQIEEIVEQVRARTPVACHAIVTIANEQKQVQQHLQSALAMMENPQEYEQGRYRLEKAFDAWHERVTLVTEIPV